jgi:hypothetical protein
VHVALLGHRRHSQSKHSALLYSRLEFPRVLSAPGVASRRVQQGWVDPPTHSSSTILHNSTSSFNPSPGRTLQPRARVVAAFPLALVRLVLLVLSQVVVRLHLQILPVLDGVVDVCQHLLQRGLFCDVQRHEAHHAIVVHLPHGRAACAPSGSTHKYLFDVGPSSGDELTRPFRHAHQTYLTRVYPIPRATRSPRKCGRCASFKGHSLSPRNRESSESLYTSRAATVPVRLRRGGWGRWTEPKGRGEGEPGRTRPATASLRRSMRGLPDGAVACSSCASMRASKSSSLRPPKKTLSGSALGAFTRVAACEAPAERSLCSV